jgi:hyperosmotically inducible protein
MKRMSRAFIGSLFSAALALTPSLYAQEQPKPAPDNTKVNKRDRSGDQMTPDKQGAANSDLALSRKIRNALHDDKSLSVYARNVKIISRDGVVTLRGPVHTPEEKTLIEQKAKDIAGAEKVKSEIQVTGNPNQ